MNICNIQKLAVLKNSRKYMSWTLIFPSEKEISRARDNEYYNHNFVIGLACTMYFSIGALIHMIINIKNNTYVYIDKDLGTLLSYYGAGYFVAQFVANEKHLLRIYKQCSDFDTFGKPTEFESMNLLLNKYSTIYCIYHTIFMSTYCSNSIILIDQCMEMNIRNNITEVCGLIGSTWLPFYYDLFPIKQVIFFYQFLVIIFIFNNAGIISYVILETVENVVIRMNHVAETFCEVLEYEDPLKRSAMFAKVAKYHIAVLEMAKTIEKSFSACMMTHITLTAPVLGTAFFRTITDHPLDSSCLCVTWTISTLIVCTAGQRFSDASENIGHKMYQASWYKLDTQLQKDVCFLMLRCSKPVFLTAGPFGYMNYAMFMLIAKTSYSFMTLLLQEM